MGDDVGVAVALQPSLALELDPTEHEHAARVVAEGVHIETLADPDFHRRRTLLVREQLSGVRQIGLVRDLDVL